MAGYSGTPLAMKLGLRETHTLFLDGAAEEVYAELAAAAGRTVVRLPSSYDLALTFHTGRASLERRFPQLLQRLPADGTIWVCWPKKAAQKALGIASDLDENVVRELGLALGVVDVKVAAIDETWSGLKFVRRLADR